MLQDDVKEMRQMTQFHYTVWPDHGVPQYTTSLQAFLTRVRKFTRNDENPLVVHCRYGILPPWVFCAIESLGNLMSAFLQKFLKNLHIAIVVLRLVLALDELGHSLEFLSCWI